MQFWAVLSFGLLAGGIVGACLGNTKGWVDGLALGTKRGYEIGKEEWKQQVRAHADAQRRTDHLSFIHPGKPCDERCEPGYRG